MQQPSDRTTAPAKSPYTTKCSTVNLTESVAKRQRIAEHRQCVVHCALQLYDEMFGEDGDPHQSLTRKNEEVDENDSGPSTAAGNSANYLPSDSVARLFGFPPTENNANVGDGAVDGDDKKSDDDDSPTTCFLRKWTNQPPHC